MLWLLHPFRKMGAWRKTIEPQKPANSLGLGQEVPERERERVRERDRETERESERERQRDRERQRETERERERVPKERAAQRVRSWTVQNEMRGVLGRVSAGAAGRILDSSNPRELKAKQ